MSTNQEPSNQMIYDLLKGHIERDERMFTDLRESLDGCDEYPGVRGRLRDIENTVKLQKRIGWGMASTVGLFVAGWIKEKLGL